jgi:hypothetical protein
MRFKTKIFAAVMGLCLQLPFLASTHAEIMQASDRVLPLEMLVPASGLDPRSLGLVSVSPLVIKGEIIGELAEYDDPGTKRPVDYLEVCDRAGYVLAVGWFDRFGILRMALDHALFVHRDEREGVFVSFLEGDPI